MTGTHLANFVFLVDTGFLHVEQAGLKLPTSGDPTTLASLSAGISGMCHHAGLKLIFFVTYMLLSFFISKIFIF